MIAATPRDEYLGNKRIPARAPTPVGYVATGELERAATAQCERSLSHEFNGAALLKKNELQKALQEFQLSLMNWKKTLGHYQNLEEHYRFNTSLLRTHRHPQEDEERNKHQTNQNDLRLTRLSVSSCHSKIGCVLYKQGNLRGALNEYRTAASLREDMEEPSGSSSEYLHSMIQSISKELQQEQVQDALLRAASMRIQAGCVHFEQGRLVLAMKEFKRAADLCRQQPNSQEALRMLFIIGSFCSDKKEELVEYLLKVGDQASINWPGASSEKTSPWLLEEKLPTLHESVTTNQKLPQVSAPTRGSAALSTLAEAASICQESSQGRRPFNDAEAKGDVIDLCAEGNEERPLKRRRKTHLDISKFKCSAGLLAAFKSLEQERLAQEENTRND
jgi:tetratricopeptide (TPR) repeat protein